MDGTDQRLRLAAHLFRQTWCSAGRLRKADVTDLTAVCSEARSRIIRPWLGNLASVAADNELSTPRSLRQQLPQHRLQDAAVAVVVQLDRRVDADASRERLGRAVGRLGRDRDRRSRLELVVQARDVEHLFAASGPATARSGRWTNSSGRTPMPTRLLRWIRSKLDGDHRADAQQVACPWRPSRGCCRCRIPRRPGPPAARPRPGTSSPRRRSSSLRRRAGAA